MRTIIMATSIALIAGACQTSGSATGVAAADADRGLDLAGANGNFLVKLTSTVSAEASEPGDPVTGVVIAPVPLRGGTVTGTIERADRSFLAFSFHTVLFAGTRYAIESEVTSVVSSQGNLGRDDLDQRIRVQGGEIVAYGTTTAINEGAEIRFVAWPATGKDGSAAD